jgi:FkbM family methyltransferase
MFRSVATRIHFLLIHIRQFGPFASLILLWKLHTKMIRIRPNTSDERFFREVFLEKVYDLGFMNLRPSTIIDGGANVGYASIFFAITYPQAKIFAVEPEDSNFEMLLRNLRFYPNIIPVHAALWPKEQELVIFDTAVGKWTFREVNALTVDRLMDLGKIDNIDVFKIDIEGAERELLSANYEKWLGKTNVIIIELHDRFQDGCTRELNNATKSYKFGREERKGQVILFKRVNKS